MLASYFVYMIFLMINFLNTTVADHESDQRALLMKVVRWIRYSIHQGERYSFRYDPLYGSPSDDVCPPESVMEMKNEVMRGFNTKKPLKSGFGSYFRAGTDVDTVIMKIEQSWALIMEDLATWPDDPTLATPKWAKTALDIRDAIGWNHFGLFNKAIRAACPKQARFGKKLPEKWDESDKWLSAKNFEAFCASTITPWPILISHFKLLQCKDRHRLRELTQFAQRFANPLFHIVLYQALLWEMENGGSAQANAEANNENDPSQPKERTHWNYVMDWLRTVLDELKKRFVSRRASVRILKMARYWHSTQDGWATQTMIDIWAKYGPHWYNVLAHVRLYGIAGLDESFKMF